MPTAQRPLEQLLIELRLQGEVLDSWAHNILSTEALLRYRREQHTLRLRTATELVQAHANAPTQQISPHQAPDIVVVTEQPTKPSRKRANKRHRRQTQDKDGKAVALSTTQDNTAIASTEASAQSQLPLETATAAAQTHNLDSVEQITTALEQQILRWTEDPSSESEAELCRLRIQRAQYCATAEQWSLALSDAHHAHELCPTDVMILRQCIKIAQESGLPQQLEYFSERCSALSSAE